MPGPVFIGGTAINNGITGTTATVAGALHANAAVGHLGIFTFFTNSGSVTVTPQAGWQLKSGPNASSTVLEGWQYYKFLTAADLGTSPSFTLSAAGRCPGVLDVISGVDDYLVYAAFTTSNSAVTNTVLTANNITTPNNGSFIYQVYSGRTATTVNTQPTASSNLTQATFSSTNFAGAVNISAMSAYYTTNPANRGTYGADTETYTNTNTNQVLYDGALAPTALVGANNFQFIDAGDGLSVTEKIR